MKSVLVVDDSEAVGRMLVRVLEQAGYEARWVGTGAEALATAEDKIPDVVLLDVRLPDADGIELAGKLRQMAGTIKLIVLSGDPLPPAKQKQVDGFLLKPPSFPEILEAVRG